MMLRLTVLGAYADPPEIRDVLIGGAVLFGICLVGGAVLMWVRRWYLSTRQRDGGPAFTLQRLREMRRSGEISEEEFRSLRRQALNLPPEATGGGACCSSGCCTTDDVECDSSEEDAQRNPSSDEDKEYE